MPWFTWCLLLTYAVAILHCLADLYEVPLSFKHHITLDLPSDTVTEKLEDDPIDGEYLTKRQTVATPLDWNSYYSMDIVVGGQTASVWLSTIDNWLWLYNSSAIFQCGSNYEELHGNCSYLGISFDPTQSDGDFINQNETFYDQYLDGKYLTGELVQDTLQLGPKGHASAELQNFTFGLVNYSSVISVGQLGLGSDAEIFSRLNTRVYSLYRTEGASSATLLFGGVNTSLFDEFYVLPMLPNVVNLSPNSNLRGGAYDFIPLSNFYAHKDGVSESVADSDLFSIPVMLDTSNVLSFLPANIVVGIAMQIGAVFYQDQNIWLQRCSYRNLAGMFVAEFGGKAKIPLPMSSILIPVYSKDSGDPVTFSSGEEVCALSILPSEWVGYSSFGVSAISQMYIMVDHGNSQIGLAPLPPDITNVTLSQSTISSSSAPSSSTDSQTNSPKTKSDHRKAKTTVSSSLVAISNNITSLDGVTMIGDATSLFNGAVTISSARANFTDIGNRAPLLMLDTSSLYLSAALSTQMIVTPGGSLLTSGLDSPTSIFPSEGWGTTPTSTSNSSSADSLRPLSICLGLVVFILSLLTIA